LLMLDSLLLLVGEKKLLLSPNMQQGVQGGALLACCSFSSEKGRGIGKERRLMEAKPCCGIWFLLLAKRVEATARRSPRHGG